MKRALILVNAFYKLESAMNQPRRLREELSLLGVDADIRQISMDTVMIEAGQAVSLLEGYDFVIYLDKDKYTSAILEMTGIRLFNRHDAILVCDDKMATHICLSGHGIAMPDTIPGLLCYQEDASLEAAMPRVELVEQKIGYPCVIKECYGSLGKGVYRADNREELLIVLEKVKCKPHLFQKMITGSIGTDVRVIVIGGKVVAAMQRISDTDFRSNIELGGRAIPYELPESFRETAERTAGILKLDYCGIDLLFGAHGEPLVCEVNSNAFFGGIESVTGINVAAAYARYMFDMIY